MLNSLAGAEHKNKDYSFAKRDYRKALRIAEKSNAQEQAATLTGNLATLALDREQWGEAESLAREALALSEKVGRQELIALDCHRLAKALLKQNEGRSRLRSPRRGQRDENDEEEKSRQRRDLQEALSMSRRAVEIFTRLRQQDTLQSAQETLGEIEEKMNRESKNRE